MATGSDLQHLDHVSGDLPTGSAPLCLFLVHNEINILPQFFAHYRGFGPVRFLAIDDRSTDGSQAFLAAQPDVSLFVPKPGSTYRAHKQQWRSEPLDLYGAGRWCLVPDADEHLVWKKAETRNFATLLSDLESEGAEGLAAVMVDMYCDRPIADHVGTDAPLAEQFPLFDDPLRDPLAYRMRLPGLSFSRKYPTPAMAIFGGMRDRVTMGGLDGETALYRWLLKNSLRRSHDPRGLARLRERLIYFLTYNSRPVAPLNLTKLPLLRWTRGMRFNGGAHHVDGRPRLSRERGVLMHFPLTRGTNGARYSAERAQHSGGGIYYRAAEDHAQKSPVYPGTSRYRGTESFGGFYP